MCYSSRLNPAKERFSEQEEIPEEITQKIAQWGKKKKERQKNRVKLRYWDLSDQIVKKEIIEKIVSEALLARMVSGNFSELLKGIHRYKRDYILLSSVNKQKVIFRSAVARRKRQICYKEIPRAQ